MINNNVMHYAIANAVVFVVVGIVVDKLTCKLSAWISRNLARERHLVDRLEPPNKSRGWMAWMMQRHKLIWLLMIIGDITHSLTLSAADR